MPKEPLNLAYVRRSDLYGFWKRLKAMGFNPARMWSKTYHVAYNSYPYLRTYWSFTKGTMAVVLVMSSHGYKLIIKNKGERKLNVHRRCWSALELPFMRYFEQTRPLELSRMGKQPAIVERWLKKQRLKDTKRKIRGMK